MYVMVTFNYLHISTIKTYARYVLIKKYARFLPQRIKCFMFNYNFFLASHLF
jgi:hypothetical protein